jgi:hypothetical protein
MDLAADAMTSLVVSLRIEVGIAFAVVLRPVVDCSVSFIRIVDVTTHTTTSDVSAPSIEIGITVPIELRSIIDVISGAAAGCQQNSDQSCGQREFYYGASFGHFGDF